ncbi:MAG: NAD-dependent epimerase/dehydratase family protein [Alphaproteobacteria bacterium]|nr:NAD-dependent epimerase/dehydratase family protein [Alphaproteobacteria bacterium]
MQRIVVTGGAGFVGSNLCVVLKQAYPEAEILAVDNLYRRGSEKILPRLAQFGIEHRNIDVRDRARVSELPAFDLLIECSAEPSVKAGVGENPTYMLDTNILGAINCIEIARKYDAKVIFLSTSRVYSIETLSSLPLKESENRFVLDLEDHPHPVGVSEFGIDTSFNTVGYRSLYGASKLSAEQIYQEYANTYNMRICILRSGVIAGPWQLGKTDQGFVSHWCASFLRKAKLNYIGFGGTGKQVRDILHIDDLAQLVLMLVEQDLGFDAKPYQIGGGLVGNISLLELTNICKEISGINIAFGHVEETHPTDIPFYISDSREIEALLGWKPSCDARRVVIDIFEWLEENSQFLRVD